MVCVSRMGGVMGCVCVEGWGHGLCLGHVGSWVVSRMGGVMGCV